MWKRKCSRYSQNNLIDLEEKIPCRDHHFSLSMALTLMAVPSLCPAVCQQLAPAAYHTLILFVQLLAQPAGVKQSEMLGCDLLCPSSCTLYFFLYTLLPVHLPYSLMSYCIPCCKCAKFISLFLWK